FVEMATRAGNNAQARATHAEDRICPECPAVLDKTQAHGLELDVCGEHGTWFDAFELGMLVRILRGEAKAAQPEKTIQCARCHRSIGADHANVTDVGLQCDSCWRGEQASEIAAFDKKIEQEGGAFAVAGVMVGVAAAMLGGSR